MSRFLGIDLGTTSFKGAVLDPDRGLLSSVRSVPAPAPVPGLPATRYELPPADVMAAVRALVGALLSEAPDARGLLVCGQMHGLVLTDELGRAHSNAITWKDQRATEFAGSATVFGRLETLVAPEDRNAIGGELRVGVPITTLRHMQRCGELSAGLYPASLLDFVVANLCGVAPGTDETNAAAHGLYHLARRDWHRELIANLGLAELRWPIVRAFGEPVGEADFTGRKLACYTPIGDQQCALAGVGLRARELSLNVSTGSQASLITPEATSGEFLTRPYLDGQRLRTIVSVPAGRSLTVLTNLITECNRGADACDDINRAVADVQDTDLEVDLSFFACLTGDRGAVRNVREDNFTVGHLFLAAFRTMARNYAHCAKVLSPARDWERVAFSGSLTHRFPRLRAEILAALGDPPFRASDNEEETLAGLLALAPRCSP
jgi:sugar (pentulose or hexulose) kinase